MSKDKIPIQVRKAIQQKNKRKKRLSKANKVTKEQIDIVRFVKIQYNIYKQTQRGLNCIGTSFAKGLQIKNRIYLVDGHFKLANATGTHIIKVYSGIPEWATNDMIQKYNMKN